jgi:hypothetical protein
MVPWVELNALVMPSWFWWLTLIPTWDAPQQILRVVPHGRTPKTPGAICKTAEWISWP